MKILRIILVSVLLMCLTSFAFSKSSLFLFGLGNFFQDVEGTYEEGVNDFANTSSYQVYGFGLGIMSSSEKTVYTGVEVHYNLQGKVTLTDPSDDDTVEIDTYKNITGLLVLGINIVKSSVIRVFVNGGGGGKYMLSAEEQTFTSSLGYETIIEVPEKKFSLMAFGGGGVIFMFSESIGAFASGRYIHVFKSDENDVSKSSIMALGGLYFSF
jgi:hypothetical protein